MNHDRPEIGGRVKAGTKDQQKRWFLDHYTHPAREIGEFLEGTSVSFAGRRILDLGCGDGIIDVGVMHHLHPSHLLGLDLVAPDTEALAAACQEILNCALPTNLNFGQCTETSLPVPDASYDLVMSWSVFEHVGQPQQVMSEVRRVLRPGGYMFLQIWPLYRSQRGSHLWSWFPEGWEHLTQSKEELRASFLTLSGTTPELQEATLADFDSLNRLSLSELQRLILSAGLTIRRVQLQSDLIDVPKQLQGYDLADLTTSGVKLLAARDF